MEKSNRYLLCAIGCALLSACATPPPLPKTTIIDTRVIDYTNGYKITVLTQNAINGNVIEDTDNNLNIVSKADNAKLIGLKVLQAAATLLGGGNSNINGYSKEQLKGNYVTSVKNNTMEYLNPELDTALKDIYPTIDKDINITIQPYKFKLIYEGLGNDDYEFRYSTNIDIDKNKFICSSSKLLSSERVQPISAWDKNNYELTQVLTKKIINDCLINIRHEIKRKATESESS